MSSLHLPRLLNARCIGSKTWRKIAGASLSFAGHVSVTELARGAEGADVGAPNGWGRTKAPRPSFVTPGSKPFDQSSWCPLTRRCRSGRTPSSLGGSFAWPSASFPALRGGHRRSRTSVVIPSVLYPISRLRKPRLSRFVEGLFLLVSSKNPCGEDDLSGLYYGPLLKHRSTGLEACGFLVHALLAPSPRFTSSWS